MLGNQLKIQKNNIIADKLDYARGKRPPVDCILCAVAEGDTRVDNLVLFRREGFFLTLNLYPYNPGHVMVVPDRHVEDIRELSPAEVLIAHRMQIFAMEVLEREYNPSGFNVGYNIGQSSGASIPHLHLQIVPRYPRELGFFDILSDSRVIVEAPQVTRERLEKAFAEAAQTLYAYP